MASREYSTALSRGIVADLPITTLVCYPGSSLLGFLSLCLLLLALRRDGCPHRGSRVCWSTFCRYL